MYGSVFNVVIGIEVMTLQGLRVFGKRGRKRSRSPNTQSPLQAALYSASHWQGSS